MLAELLSTDNPMAAGSVANKNEAAMSGNAMPLWRGGRRAFGGLAGFLLTATAEAAVGHGGFRVRDLRVPGNRRIGQRFSMLVPQHPLAQPLRVLVLLHGLGETHSQSLGARAWIDRYGLGSCYQRLLTPPIRPLARRHRHWFKPQIHRINASLKAHPFRGFAIICPYTPNVYRLPRKKALDDYAAWLSDEVLPRARREANLSPKPQHLHLGGCSLGGYVGLEVWLRKPKLFGGFSSVQGALGRHRIGRFSQALERMTQQEGQRPILLASSSADPFLNVNQKLYKQLRKRGLSADLHVGKGPHNQPYLRDHGTLQMLLWHDRNMA